MAERKAAEEVREQAPAAEPDARANSGGVNILFVGDVVGGIGKRTLLDSLPILRERYAPTFVVDHMLVDAETLPEQHGPKSWGIPHPLRWQGGY